MNLKKHLKVAELALKRHKKTAFCETPHTCGGCHWYQGYIAAMKDVIDDQQPNRLVIPKRKRKIRKTVGRAISGKVFDMLISQIRSPKRTNQRTPTTETQLPANEG